MRTFLLAAPLLVLAPLGCGDDSSEGSGGGGTGGETPSATTNTATSSSVTSATTTSGGGGDPSGGGGSGEGGGDGGGTTSGTGGGGTILCEATPSEAREEAAVAYTTSLCTYYERCLPALFVLVGGNLETCVGVQAYAVGSIANVDDDALVGCLAAGSEIIDAAACGDFDGTELAAACAGVGTLDDGAGCTSSIECAGGACVVPAQEDCGTCGSLVDEGGACTDDVECGALACVEGACQGAQLDGAACDSARDCEGGACAQGECATVSIVGRGDACGGLVQCDPTEEILCDTDLGECIDNPRPEPGQVGEACVDYAVDLGGGFVFTVGTCEVGSICLDDVCVPSALPGESCAGDVQCVNAGCEGDVCVPPDQNACACGG